MAKIKRAEKSEAKKKEDKVKDLQEQPGILSAYFQGIESYQQFRG